MLQTLARSADRPKETNSLNKPSPRNKDAV